MRFRCAKLLTEKSAPRTRRVHTLTFARASPPLFAVAALLAFAPFATAQRKPVLQQIDLPHPYYYREMYLPQLTSGPSSVTWSPDSREVIYSMAGSLWRQRIDSTTAQQLTDGN